MKLAPICKNYFNGFNEFANRKQNSSKINALAILKIISYFTGIIPGFFGILYGLSLCGRVHKKTVTTEVEKKMQDIVKITLPEVPVAIPDRKFPSIEMVHNYPGDLTAEQKVKIHANDQSGILQLHFNNHPLFAVTIRLENIFDSKASCIVNAANTHLGGGGGIDGAIHRAGGDLYKEAHKAMKEHFHGDYKEGYAAMIDSGDLKAKGIENVIVVAGPSGDTNPEKENQLYSCYYNSLLLAHQQNKESLAFPSISTGIFRFPKERAAAISLRAIYDFLEKHPQSNLKSISIHFLPNEPVSNQLEYQKHLHVEI